MGSPHGGEGSAITTQEKPLSWAREPVPQTDTGRLAEDAKVGELTPLKELGKLTP